MDFESPQVEYTLYAKVSAVDVVTQEEISRLCWVTADLEQLHEIIVLSVNVAAHRDGCIHFQQVRFVAEDFATLGNDEKRLFLGQATLAVEVLLQKVDIGLGPLLVVVELLIGGLGHGRRLHIFSPSVGAL